MGTEHEKRDHTLNC